MSISRVAIRLGSKYPEVKVESLLVAALHSAEVVSAEALPSQVCTDIDDDKCIACAISAKINVIISGDGALKAVGEFNGVKIISPAEFVETYLEE